MVVRLKFLMHAVTAVLIMMFFVVVITLIIKIWMFAAPVKRRRRPSYSLHVMNDIPPDPSHKPLHKRRKKFSLSGLEGSSVVSSAAPYKPPSHYNSSTEDSNQAKMPLSHYSFASSTRYV